MNVKKRVATLALAVTLAAGGAGVAYADTYR